MTRYALLVRGINVGGKNKVVMAELRQELTDLGLEKVETYINSGNIFFTSTAPKAQLVKKLETFFEIHYPFIQSFSLLSQEDYEAELENLPDWWTKDLARKDVLFYTESLDVDQVIEKVNSLELEDEVVHFGRLGIFWGKFSEGNSLRNPTMQLPIISTCSRCLSTATLLFVMLKPLTKLVKC